MDSCGNSKDVLTTPVPEHWNKPPTLEIVDTEYAFDMHVDRDKNHKWLFDAELDKLFIKLKEIMKVKVSYKPPEDNSGKLILRAMILFATSDDIQQEVKRCLNHRYVRDDEVLPQEHILKCFHHDTQYIGDENGKLFGERLSLLVPLGSAVIEDNGKASQSITFQFMCQNSCASGIGRKPTLILFTLENEGREILGKKVLPFTVCSNPKREMARENSFKLGKRKANCVLHEKLYSKMVRLPQTPHTFTVPVPDINNMRSIIRTAINTITEIEGEGAGNEQYMASIQSILQSFLNSLDNFGCQ